MMKTMKSVSELVKGKIAVFHYIIKNEALWYGIEGEQFCFPIPFEEAKGGIFRRRMKAIELMRWIRKYHDIVVELEGKKAIFDHYSDGEAWYDVDGFIFPVDVKHMVTGSMYDEYAAYQLSDYIVAHRKTTEEWKKIAKEHASGQATQ